MKIVLLGPPGAGKGTQAAQMAERYGIPHISTGAMMRGAVRADDELGRRAKSYLDRGRLVPDAVMIEVVRERLSQADCAHGFVLDGFPRTLAQANSLEDLVNDLGCPLSHVVELRVPGDVLEERLLARGRDGARSDDTLGVISERLRVYEQQTRPVSEFYEMKGRILVVDGVGSVEEVEQRVERIVEQNLPGNRSRHS